MQDSMEEYLNLTRGRNEMKISKELVATAQMKKDCDNKAMKIVEFCIEGKLRPDVFSRCLSHITQLHYQDIVVERAITKLCGYCLCNKSLPEMPKKQYYISTKSNKVYDIQDRKNYCSNFCYRASIHVKKQVATSPLWLRGSDRVGEFKFLSRSQGGVPGELIDHGMVKPVDEEIKFTSVNSIAQSSLFKTDKPTKRKKDDKPMKMQTIKELSEIEEKEEVILKERKGKKKSSIGGLPSIEENEEKPPENNYDSIKTLIENLMTIDTCIFIHGEDKIKQILNEQKLNVEFDRLHIDELHVEHQQKYMNICRKLHFQEMAEEQFDRTLRGDNIYHPLPDYQQLKLTTNDLKLKVKAFYQGSEYEAATDDKKEDKDGAPAVLPLVDVGNQKLLRRNIFLSSLSKSIQHHLPALGLSYLTVVSDLQQLVKTFNLTATNITHKPATWNIIALIILYLLSMKDKEIQECLDTSSSLEYIKLILGDNQLISEILQPIQNIEEFIERYITKKL